MTPQPGTSQRNWLIRTTFVALATLAFANVLLANARAADLAEQAHSLKKVPADASFYSASLRFKEQWHSFLESKAFAKLMEIPLVQMAKMQITFQWQQSEQPTIAKVREYVQSPAGQDAVAILKEMFSDEVFVYGGSDIAETISVLMELNSMRRTAPLDIDRRREGQQRKLPPTAFSKSWKSIPTSSKCPRWLLVSGSKTRHGRSGSSTRFIRSFAICWIRPSPIWPPICSATRSREMSSSRSGSMARCSLGTKSAKRPRTSMTSNSKR